MSANVYELLTPAIVSRSAAPALETESGVLYSYQQFDRWTARYAALLAAKNVKPGDRVLVQADKSAHLLMLCYACLRAGAVFVPLNLGARSQEIASVVSDAAPALVLCDPRRAPVYDVLRRQDTDYPILTLSAKGLGTAPSEAEQMTDEFPPEPLPADAPAALMYTSGTTGEPKAAIITHGNIASNGVAWRDFWKWRAKDVLLHPLPLHHLHGLFVATVPSLLTGAKILLLRRFTTSGVLPRMKQASVFMGVPTYFSRLLQSPLLTRERCAHMRLFISGSAPLRGHDFAQFLARTGHAILARYGLTETGGMTCNPVGEPLKMGESGIPLPNVELLIANHAGELLPEGSTGEVLARGPSVFPGYWQRPQETARAFTADGYFRTGDLGRWLADGSLEIVGRAKDVIITGGANVNPLEVEAAIDACPGVAESAVFGVPDDDYGEAVIAVIVREKTGTMEADSEAFRKQLQTRLRRNLAAYKMPRKLLFRGELPRNTMGKVQKHVLRNEHEKRVPAAPEHSAQAGD